ncbi:hypothetical protein OUZ56_030965 [Daphnia magna]|uniref:Uncharacterized protein n=1 Tax=Daphnia magna TaxID=35525 RepID=A0ABQ9ZTC9_9CRUS|nr:hypothetical protein OUZ56_030965 [Daphnia magna]
MSSYMKILQVLSALRTDLIESASHRSSSRTDAKKTRHNDSEMVRQSRIHGRVVEPL